MISPSIVTLNVAYYLLKPQYNCFYNDPITNTTYTQHCSYREACSAETPLNIDWNSKFSLINWIDRLNLHFMDSYVLGLFGTLFFTGYLLSLFANPLADVFGRRIYIKMSIIVSIICYTSLIYSTNLYVNFAMMFVCGILAPWKAMISYSHFMEFIKGRENKYTGYLCFCYFCWLTLK